MVRKLLGALTANQQREIARQEFAKAKLLLSEADAIHKVSKAYGACVGAAYYAMEHAACAAILLLGGVGAARGFPKSHRDIMLHFGTLTANEILLRPFGDLLRQVYGLREIADYSVTRHPDKSDADFALKSAQELLAACVEKWRAVIDPTRL